MLAGSLNYDGAVVCRAESLGEATVLAQITRMVEQAQSSRAPMERLADRASAIFVPVVLGLAAVTFVGVADCGALAAAGAGQYGGRAGDCLPVRDGTGGAGGADGGGGPRRATGRAVQRRRSAGAAGASGRDCPGQDGNADGGPAGAGRQFDCGYAGRLAENDLLRMAAAAEERSNHPLAHAVIDAAQARGLIWQPAEDVQIFPGRGLTARVEGHECLLGNEALFGEFGIALPSDRCGAGAGRDAAVDGAGRRGCRLF